MADTVSPHDLDAERHVLGSLMIDTEAVHRVTSILGEQTTVFFKTAHQLVYGAALRLTQRNDPIDLYTISDDLKRAGDLQRVGSVEYLYNMQESVPTAANIEYYAEIVREHATRRALIEAGTSIIERARSPELELDTVVDDSQRIVFDVHQRRARREFVGIVPVLHDSMDYIERLYEQKNQLLGLPTGIDDLDILLSGLNRSDLIVVAGRPSMGKSAFVHNIALNAAGNPDVTVALVTLEMGREQVMTRMLSTVARIDMQKVRTGHLTDNEWQRLSEATGVLEKLSMYINDSPGSTIGEIRSEARRLKMQRPNLGLLIIDYLQLVQGGSRGNQNREQEIAEYSRALKDLARELDVAIIALSQLNRAVESRDNKRPQLSDLRESGAIEQDADIVMFLYRDEYYRPDTTETPGLVEIKVAKHRNGPTGTVTAQFKQNHLLFTRADDVSTEYS